MSSERTFKRLQAVHVPAHERNCHTCVYHTPRMNPACNGCTNYAYDINGKHTNFQKNINTVFKWEQNLDSS